MVGRCGGRGRAPAGLKRTALQRTKQDTLWPLPIKQSRGAVFIWGFPKIRGTFFGGYYRKDYRMSGSILGSPYFGKLPYHASPLGDPRYRTG